MPTTHVTERSEEDDESRRALKRRGILAAAATAVAAIMVKQTAQPVAAAAPMLFADTPAQVTNNAGGQTLLTGNFTPPTSPFNKPLLYVGNTSSTGSALEGSASGSGFGVVGSSSTGSGVSGVTFGTGVVSGVLGTSGSAYGIIGSSTASGYSGLTAITSTPNVAALGATATVPTAYAAFFTGTTVVNGNFVATGGTKSAAVPLGEGHRLVYCVESPESWFEDFGEAKLVNGKADVKLDPDFAAIVHTDAYHVFLTAHHTEGGALSVTERHADRFVVRERNGGTSSGSLSYRIVARRKDIVGERLAKFVMPKINHPDPDKLPRP